MKPTTKGEFFRLLKKSRLLTASQRVAAKECCQSLTDSAAAASRLVGEGMLTPWQGAQLLLGRTQFYFGRYKLLKFRGRGAMGVVFKAEQPDLRRTVAIKILSKALLNKPRSISRFLREIRSTATLNHPNLVVAYDADQVADTYCLVMEYISGRSLKTFCSEFGQLPLLWSCECIRQAALGIQHIHERGLVHRDIKPSNLLVAGPSLQEPQVKLLDIGLARFVSETEEEGGLTRDGQIVGTGNYMAPEQVAKARTADIRADIYSLGASLYEMLTGVPPLSGGTLLQTYMNRLQKEPPPVSAARRDVPPRLDAIICKMLKRDPDQRYQTPAEVAADLAALIAEVSVDPAALAVVFRPLSAQRPGDAELQSTGMTLTDSKPTVSVLQQTREFAQSASSDASGDRSLTEFLDQFSSDLIETVPSMGRWQRRSQSGLLRAIQETTSRIGRGFWRRLSQLRSGSDAKHPFANNRRRPPE